MRIIAIAIDRALQNQEAGTGDLGGRGSTSASATRSRRR